MLRFEVILARTGPSYLMLYAVSNLRRPDDVDMNWDDPQMVSLYERLAATIQQEYQDSLTTNGIVANPDHLGARAASQILAAATAAEFGTMDWKLGFAPDSFPHRTSTQHCCATCAAGEGQLHEDYCNRYGRLMRASDERVTL